MCETNAAVTLNKEKSTRSATAKFFGLSLAVLLLTQLTVVVLKPDQDLSGKRMLMASKQSGLVHRLYAETAVHQVPQSGGSLVFDDWKKGHRLLNDQFPSADRSSSIDEQFTILNRAFYRIEELLQSSQLDSFELLSLTPHIDDYSKAADRIFLFESSQMSAALTRHTWVMMGLTTLSMLLVFVFYNAFIRRQIKVLTVERENAQLALEEEEGTVSQLKNFILKVSTGFTSDLEKLRSSELPPKIDKDFLRLQRTARSTKVFSEFLLDVRTESKAPFSLDALLQDVSDYLTLHSEFSSSSVECSIVSSHRSAEGNTDLIGTLLSQFLIVLLELPSAGKVNLSASIEPAEDERARLLFTFKVEADQPGGGVGLANDLKAIPLKGEEHFGMAMVEGIVKMLNARLWLSEGKPGLPLLNISLVCDAYDDEVAIDDTTHLSGKRVFVLDSQTENLRTLVKQLSGYGIQATPFNSLAPIIENPALLARFDGGIIVNRTDQENMPDFVSNLRKHYADQDLPLLAIYPDERAVNSGIAWNALLSGSNTEAELLSALAFCMLPASRREAENNKGTSSTGQPFALQRANR